MNEPNLCSLNHSAFLSRVGYFTYVHWTVESFHCKANLCKCKSSFLLNFFSLNFLHPSLHLLFFLHSSFHLSFFLSFFLSFLLALFLPSFLLTHWSILLSNFFPVSVRFKHVISFLLNKVVKDYSAEVALLYLIERTLVHSVKQRNMNSQMRMFTYSRVSMVCPRQDGAKNDLWSDEKLNETGNQWQRH